MRWPRGRWNGLRIVGFRFKVCVRTDQWEWWPIYVPLCGGLHWLCVYTWTEWEYEPW